MANGGAFFDKKFQGDKRKPFYTIPFREDYPPRPADIPKFNLNAPFQIHKSWLARPDRYRPHRTGIRTP